VKDAGGVKRMKVKKAVITVELVSESLLEPDKKIVQELMEWFREDAVSAPWIKDVKSITVRTTGRSE
jgi:hypothetical protein